METSTIVAKYNLMALSFRSYQKYSHDYNLENVLIRRKCHSKHYKQIFQYYISKSGPGTKIQCIHYHLQVPGFYTSTSSCPSCFTSNSAPCLWPAKSSRRRPKVLRPCTHLRDLEEAPSFRLVQLQPLCPLGSEASIEDSSLCFSFFQ